MTKTRIYSTPEIPIHQEQVLVASLQGNSVFGDTEANVATFTRLAEEAAENGAKILVLPEAAVTGYLSTDLKTNWGLPDRPKDLAKYSNHLDPTDFAEFFPDGPSLLHFSALSKKLDVYITIPFLEKAYAYGSEEDDEYIEEESKENISSGEKGEDNTTNDAATRPLVFYSSICLASPSGELVAHYRKLSPWPTPEKSWATTGDLGPVTYQTEYGKIGLALSFDIHSILSKYKRHKLWSLLYPVAYVGDPLTWFRKELPSLLHQCKCPHYILSANWSVEPDIKSLLWDGAGISTHFGPSGSLVASTNAYLGGTVLYSSIFTQRAQQAQLERAAVLAATQEKKDGEDTKSSSPVAGGLDLDKYSQWTSTIGAQSKEWKWRGE